MAQHERVPAERRETACGFLGSGLLVATFLGDQNNTMVIMTGLLIIAVIVVVAFSSLLLLLLLLLLSCISRCCRENLPNLRYSIQWHHYHRKPS